MSRLWYFASLFLASPLLIGAIWLGAVAVTWQGRLSALIGALVYLLPFCGWQWVAIGRGRGGWKWASLGLVAMLLFLSLLLVGQAPSGSPPAGSSIHHRYLGNQRFVRYRVTNIIPEVEQINLGFKVMPWLDPLLTRQQARASVVDTLAIYQEMESDPDFRLLGSEMQRAYLDLFGLAGPPGHYFLYDAEQAAAEPRPLLIFLHGSAGNFKAYTWIFSQLAAQEDALLAVPSYGFGNWDAAGTDFVLAIIDDVTAAYPVDTNRIYLIGLSNGGIGTLRTVAAAPEQINGYVLISPVMPTELLRSQANAHSLPVLVITGEQDRRIPVSYVREQAAAIRSFGSTVDLVTYPEEDHFLLFSQPETILNDIASWLHP